MVDASVPPGLSVAFYKGTRPGIAGLYNRLGRYLDGGPYSHCEMVFSDGVSGSSSFLDKGVRFKEIGYSSVGCWDFLPITYPRLLGGEVKIRQWFKDHEGEPYDILGNIRFGIGFVRESADKSFCSEAIMASVGYEEAYRYGPSGAAILLSKFLNTPIIIIQPPPKDAQYDAPIV